MHQIEYQKKKNDYCFSTLLIRCYKHRIIMRGIVGLKTITD